MYVSARMTVGCAVSRRRRHGQVVPAAADHLGAASGDHLGDGQHGRRRLSGAGRHAALVRRPGPRRRLAGAVCPAGLAARRHTALEALQTPGHRRDLHGGRRLLPGEPRGGQFGVQLLDLSKVG